MLRTFQKPLVAPEILFLELEIKILKTTVNTMDILLSIYYNLSCLSVTN